MSPNSRSKKGESTQIVKSTFRRCWPLLRAEYSITQTDPAAPTTNAIKPALRKIQNSVRLADSIEAFHQRPLAARINRHSAEAQLTGGRFAQFFGQCQKIFRLDTSSNEDFLGR